MKQLLVAFFLLFAVPAWAEELTLTTPEVRPSLAKWVFMAMSFDKDAAQFTVTFREKTTSELRTCTVSGPLATTIINTLDTANNTTIPMHKRALQWGQGRPGCLGPGTIAP